MLATAKNYDVICLQMRRHSSRLEPSLKGELDDLLMEVRKGLSDAQEAKQLIDHMLPRIFYFRIKALQWLVAEGGVNLSALLDEVHPQIQRLRHNPRLQILSENIQFALRCNRRVIQSLMSAGGFSNEELRSKVKGLPATTYSDFLVTLAYSIPDDEAAQRLVDWMNASLYIEFVALAAVMINDENLNVPDRFINELSFLVADAAQQYTAIALETGLLKSRTKAPELFPEQSDADFVKEQKQLADLGIDEWAKNF